MPPKSELEKICEYAKGLGNNDLQALIAKLNEETARRERKQREEDWNTVRHAIADYIERWGTIQVYNYDDEHSVDIGSRSDFSSIGEIDVNY